MFELDEISYLLTVDTDYSLQEIEAELAKKSFTLGYFSPPRNEVILEQVLSEKLPNLHGLYYGELPELCVALALETPRSEVIQTHPAPRKATGPDWKNLILGSQKRLGVIYQATLKVFLKPEHTFYSFVKVPDLEASRLLEQKLRYRELIPLSYGRFESKDLPKKLAWDGSSYFLVCEWAASQGILEALRAELEKILSPEYSYRLFDIETEKREIYKLLRQALPLPWGPQDAKTENPQLEQCAEELLNILC